EGEEVEIGEEAPVARVLVHVAGGIDVDEAADSRDHEDHHRRQRVDREGEVDVEVADVDPRQHGGEEPWHAVLGLEPEELDEGDVVDVGGVEDQLDHHEDADRVAARDDAEETEREEDGRQDHEVDERRPAHPFTSLRDTTIAPMRAASSTTEATSKGST